MGRGPVRRIRTNITILSYWYLTSHLLFRFHGCLHLLCQLVNVLLHSHESLLELGLSAFNLILLLLDLARFFVQGPFHLGV